MEKTFVHGNNQSVDTKFATVLVDDAITFIESGRIEKGLALMQRVLTLLPDMGLERQAEYFKKHAELRARVRGFQ